MSSLEVKRFAWMSLGELSGLRSGNRWLGSMQAASVIDAAFTRYRSEHNAKMGAREPSLTVDQHNAPYNQGTFTNKQADVNDGDDEEAKKAMFVKSQCEYGKIIFKRLSDPDEDHDEQGARYKKIQDKCIGLLDTIDDEFYRGFATHQVIEMCITSGDYDLAKTLLVSVRDGLIREKIFESCPSLKTGG